MGTVYIPCVHRPVCGSGGLAPRMTTLSYTHRIHLQPESCAVPSAPLAPSGPTSLVLRGGGLFSVWSNVNRVGRSGPSRCEINAPLPLFPLISNTLRDNRLVSDTRVTRVIMIQRCDTRHAFSVHAELVSTAPTIMHTTTKTAGMVADQNLTKRMS